MRKFLTISLIFFAASSFFAQSFTAEVNKPSVPVNEEFEVTFTYSTSSAGNITSFNPPDLSAFTVLTGPNQAQNTQIYNGAMSIALSFTYYLQPKKEGTFTIGKASVVVGGKTYSSDPVTVTIVAAGKQSKNSQQENNSGESLNIGDNVFIRAIADKQRVSVGEQVTVTYKLYTRLNITASPQISKMPTYQGFWSEDLEPIQRINFTMETYNGKQFKTATIKKVALFPAKEGKLTVTPFELTIPVETPRKRKSSGSVFDDFFNDPFFNAGQTVNYEAKSNSIVITAEPLRGQAPASFKGAVGDYNLRVSADNNTVKANEPVTIKMSITGTGNIRLINPPELEAPSSFEKYEPKTSEKVNNSGKISGEKTIEYLLIPRSEGDYEIPSVEFSFYNPGTDKYETLTSQKINLHVTKGTASFDQAASGYNKSDVELLKQDIRFIKTSEGEITRKGSYAVFSFWFWAITILPLFVVTGGIIWKKKNDDLAGNVSALRYQKAEKMAKGRLKNAKRLLDLKNKEGFYTEISYALFGYLEDKLRIPKSDFSIEKAESELRAKGFTEELIARTSDCAERCEFARFAPASDLSAEMSSFYDQTVKLIVDLEKSFQAKK